MKDSIQIDWLSDMAFETEVNGHKIYLDAGEKVGGKNLGPRPKAFMMVALAGCTGMDVVSILRKMRVSEGKGIFAGKNLIIEFVSSPSNPRPSFCPVIVPIELLGIPINSMP